MQWLRVLIVLAALLGGLVPASAAEASRLLRGEQAHTSVRAPIERPHTSATVHRQPPQLRREGRWLVDPQGRVVIVHGLNLVYKRKPYVPPNGPTGFTKRRRVVAGAARLQRRPGRHPVGRAHAQWPRPGRPGVPRPVATGARPAGQQADLDPARHAPGPVARGVRRRGGAGLGGPRGNCRSTSLRRWWRRSRPATGRPRSRRCSTTSGPTAGAYSTVGWRPGRSPRSAGSTSPT